MSLTVGDTAPDFSADTSQGPINFHEWIGDGWAILFSHPKDFTPVCTTELGYMASLKPEFDKRNCKIIGLSVDPADSHRAWAQDIRDATGHAPNYPIIADTELAVAKHYGMLAANAGNTSEGRTPMDNATVRSVFVIGPDKLIKLTITYPMSTGRNFDEVLRVLDSVQLTASAQGGHAGELESRGQGHHPAGGFGRRRPGKVPSGLGFPQALHPFRRSALRVGFGLIGPVDPGANGPEKSAETTERNSNLKRLRVRGQIAESSGDPEVSPSPIEPAR